MSALIDLNNTLFRLEGVRSYSEWQSFVFNRDITSEHDETENRWLERIANTAAAIEEHIIWLENDDKTPRHILLEEISRLEQRISEIMNTLDVCSNTLCLERNYSVSTNLPTRAHQGNKRDYTVSKLTELIEVLLREDPSLSTNAVWTYFYKNVDNEIYDLIDILEVTDKTSNEAIMQWACVKTGKAGKITRRSLASLLSRCRKKFSQN